MSLPLNDIVKIVVNLSPRAAIRRGFNLGLLVGPSEVISPEERVRIYSGTDAMIEDGFATDSPEVIAAGRMFKQRPAPTRVAIGRRVVLEDVAGQFEVTSVVGSEADNFIVNWDHVAEGSNTFVFYTPYDLSVVPEYHDVMEAPWAAIVPGQEITPNPGATFVMVAEVDVAGRMINIGAASLPGGSQSLGLEMCESPTDAIRACRAANSEWYPVTYLGASTDDIMSIAEYVETVDPVSVQMYTTNDPLVLTNDPNGIFARLRAKGFMRSLGQYSFTPDAVTGIMGYAMGANTRMSRSAYTLMHKRVVGVAPDNLSQPDVDGIQRGNGNYYVSRGPDGEYSMFERGTMADGTWFDEVINLDMLVNEMQKAILDHLASVPKVAQTEDGVTEIKIKMKPSLRRARIIGFIAPGVWNGPTIWLTEDYAPLQTGDRLADGWDILSEPVDDQSQADREERVSPPIYVPIKLAGAIHTVLVQINVNR